jgi:hypothetical protein
METARTQITMNKSHMLPPVFPLSRYSIMPRTDQASCNLRALGWRETILDMNTICGRCNQILKKGAPAAVAIIEGNGYKPSICLHCLKEMTHENS